MLTEPSGEAARRAATASSREANRSPGGRPRIHACRTPRSGPKLTNCATFPCRASRSRMSSLKWPAIRGGYRGGAASRSPSLLWEVDIELVLVWEYIDDKSRDDRAGNPEPVQGGIRRDPRVEPETGLPEMDRQTEEVATTGKVEKPSTISAQPTPKGLLPAKTPRAE